MSYAQNRRSFESTTSYATLWSNTNWNKAQKYVDKQQRRIYRAESNNDKRKCYLKDLDNGLFEPYVLKGTRAVLRSATS